MEEEENSSKAVPLKIRFRGRQLGRPTPGRFGEFHVSGTQSGQDQDPARWNTFTLHQREGKH